MTSQGDSATDPYHSSPNPITKKKSIRGGYRAYATKLIAEAREFLDNEPFSPLRAEKQKFFLNARLILLREIDAEIFYLISDDDIEAEVIECEEIQTSIQSIIIEIETKKRAFETAGQNSPAPEPAADAAAVEQGAVTAAPEQPTPQPAATIVSSTPEPTASTMASEPTAASTPDLRATDVAKLPKLNLQKFFGNPKKWQEWWDSYEIIHGNPTLSAVNKFRHLRSLLEGPAAAAIAGIQTTNANYNEAIEILKDRFARKQVIINSHMESLLNLTQVSNEQDIKNLRKLYDNIETHVRSLKSLGIDFIQYGALLVPMIMSKIPNEIRLGGQERSTRQNGHLKRY